MQDQPSPISAAAKLYAMVPADIVCHVNSQICDTQNKKFDPDEDYDAYLVKYSRVGLVEKYRWDYVKKDFIKY